MSSCGRDGAHYYTVPIPISCLNGKRVGTISDAGSSIICLTRKLSEISSTCHFLRNFFSLEATSIVSTDVSSVCSTGGTPIVLSGDAIANLKGEAWVKFCIADCVSSLRFHEFHYSVPLTKYDMCLVRGSRFWRIPREQKLCSSNQSGSLWRCPGIVSSRG